MGWLQGGRSRGQGDGQLRPYQISTGQSRVTSRVGCGLRVVVRYTHNAASGLRPAGMPVVFCSPWYVTGGARAYCLLGTTAQAALRGRRSIQYTEVLHVCAILASNTFPAICCPTAGCPPQRRAPFSPPIAIPSCPETPFPSLAIVVFPTWAGHSKGRSPESCT